MPNTPNYEREPALTIGEIFANKTLIRPAIAAAVAIAAGLFNLTIGNETVDNLTTVVMFAAMLYAPIAANREQKNLATEQAKETREKVYAPATVKRIARESAEAGEPMVDPPPAA